MGNIHSSPAGEGKTREGETKRQALFPRRVVLPNGTPSSVGRTKPAESEVGCRGSDPGKGTREVRLVSGEGSMSGDCRLVAGAFAGRAWSGLGGARHREQV